MSCRRKSPCPIVFRTDVISAIYAPYVFSFATRSCSDCANFPTSSFVFTESSASKSPFAKESTTLTNRLNGYTMLIVIYKPIAIIIISEITISVVIIAIEADAFAFISVRRSAI